MDDLLEAAADLVSLLSPERVRAIADRLRDSRPTEKRPALLQLVATPVARCAMERILVASEQTNVSGDVLAGILVGAVHTRLKTQQESSLELVWTGPTTSYVATRRTEQVLLDLIRHAQKEVFLVSFVAYDVTAVVDALNSAAERGVDLLMLLESSADQGGSLTYDPISMMRKYVPSAVLYSWIDRSAPFIDGKVHAKVAVADGATAFITSANLTGHALEKNMEAGVIIRGGSLPSDLRAHLRALIDTKVIRKS